MGVVNRVSKVVALYSFAVWVYVVASILDPVTTEFQKAPLSYFVPIPTDLVGILSFSISFVAALVWQLTK